MESFTTQKAVLLIQERDAEKKIGRPKKLEKNNGRK